MSDPFAKDAAGVVVNGECLPAVFPEMRESLYRELPDGLHGRMVSQWNRFRQALSDKKSCPGGEGRMKWCRD